MPPLAQVKRAASTFQDGVSGEAAEPGSRDGDLVQKFGVWCGQRTNHALDAAGGGVGERYIQQPCPGVYDGLAIHRRVLNCYETFLLYSSFHRVTNQSI